MQICAYGRCFQKVIWNGTGMPGNVIEAISQEAMDEAENADLLISVGQEILKD